MDALKLTDRPNILSIDVFFKRSARNCPYKHVRKMIRRADYAGLAELLTGEWHGRVRRVAAVPTVLLHTSAVKVQQVYEAMKKRGADQELLYCASLARDLSQRHDDTVPSHIERLAVAYNGKPSALRGLSFSEFNHIYEVYFYSSR